MHRMTLLQVLLPLRLSYQQEVPYFLLLSSVSEIPSQDESVDQQIVKILDSLEDKNEQSRDKYQSCNNENYNEHNMNAARKNAHYRRETAAA